MAVKSEGQNLNLTIRPHGMSECTKDDGLGSKSRVSQWWRREGQRFAFEFLGIFPKFDVSWAG